MTVILRDGFTPFLPRARLIKLLGGELIRDEVMAVMELVKNAYDADATRVCLNFGGASTQEGVLIIEDDGSGMGVNVLLQHWMQPAGSSKSGRGCQYTAGGRRMLGEKGVGRFAVDRLGRHVELVSRERNSETEIVAVFDWDQFDDDTRLLSDVGVKWREQKAQLMCQAGTRIRITGLRTTWKERTFRRLCTQLQRLLSPGTGHAAFEISVESDEFPDYQGTLKSPILERATYRIQADFDGSENILCRMREGHVLRHVWNGPGDLSCGPVRVSLHCFDLNSETLAKIGPPQEVRAWLREWSGISIYRDGFRVLPYGEPDDDWLRLDQRRVNSPVERLSNNQVCGYAEIGRDTNPELRDQTNRGGLLQNRPFEDLRRLVLFVLATVEAERQTVRNPPGAVYSKATVNQDHTATDEALNELKTVIGRTRVGKTSVQSLIDRVARNLENERKAREQEIKRFLEMAAIGHGAAVASHALAPRLRQLRALVRAFNRGKSTLPTAAYYQVEAVLAELEQTAHFIGTIAPSRREASRTINVGKELQDIESSVASLVASHGVTLRVTLRQETVTRAEIVRSDFHQVLHILLWNSLDALARQERKGIELRIAPPEADFCRVLFRDTGLGVEPELREQIFEFNSSKPNGRGMGLTIVRQLLSRAGGEVRLLPRRSGSPWTTFELKLRLRRSRATPH